MSDGDVALALIHHVRQTATCTVCKLPFRCPCMLPACLHTFCCQCIQPVDINCETVEESHSKVLCPRCSEESVLSSADGGQIAVKDYFANKLLESTGHLLSLNQYGRNYSLFCEFVKKLRDACECPVCQELCCQPRMLPCSHTFCVKCLKGCTTNASNSYRWSPCLPRCPLCRQVYSHPAEGLSALPTNKLLSRILDKLSEPEVQQLVSRLLNPDRVDRRHCEVIGVAELHGRLYVLHNKSKSIRVSLAEKPYSLLSDVPLDEVIEPTDLAASMFDNCLYVTDVGEVGCVWRVQVVEQVVESTLEQIELKVYQSEGRSAMSSSVRLESAQGSDKELERQVEEMKRTESCRVACATGDDLQVASIAGDACVASADDLQQQLQHSGGKIEKCGRSIRKDNASQLQEPISGDQKQCGQTSIDLRTFLQTESGGEVDAANVSQHDKSQTSPMTVVEAIKDDDAGEMIQGLLQRTGLMKKIAEHGNAGRPCMFEISRHYKVKRWVERVKSTAVSVGTDGQVILVTDHGHLVIYSASGQLIVDHSLPEDVQKPRHAVFSSSSGTFIVSHSSVDGIIHRVSELILDPVLSCLYVARCYGSTTGRLQQHLHWPRHLTVDERGWLFVADCGNDRVLLLDEKLRLRRVMLSELEGVKQPWRLCFIAETGILAVGSVTGSVALFLVVGGKTSKKKK